ncbi:hypothetical protein HO173_001659 [Letharia columbiana]|uniref:Mid2 domain-containing protein n=1 Tax=Letharia columbiana TaxID=112416 RepID=A0A8H6G3S8_9LECA|nr:uncharacterized protein HO173_001659 [Letharia columbiana]KAF6240049.1 hypothetical protein HO173_001659 [Letharia columbiana]
MLPQLAGHLLFFLATTSLLPSTASADTANWLFPAYVQNAPPITLESQDTMDASWTSEFVAPVLVMFCQTGNDGDFSINFESPIPVLPNGSYAIPLNSVQDTDSGCHLNLNETNGPLMGTANSSNSGNFLVNVQSDRSATTWSTSIAAATTSSSISTSTSTPTTISASTSSSSSGTPSAAAATATGKSASPQPNNGLSSGAKAGIGVGVSLGVLALISAGLLLWARARRKQRQIPPPKSQKQEYAGTYASEVDGNHIPSEMDGRNLQEEKDGFPIARRQTAGELEADPAR